MDLSRNPAFFELLAGSYRRMVGAEPPFLVSGEPHSAEWLYDRAPWCVVAHNMAPDPRFIYANRAAQRLFGYSFAEFTALPSRLSAGPADRAERQRLLDSVAAQGYATGYSGLRIAKSGRRFWIKDGVIWQLVDEAGVARGQAATFGNWRDA
ncbi:MAG: MEKHLA domain-containing protein [Methyloceanibacter sp.]